MTDNWKLIGKILKTKGFDGTTIVAFDYPIIEAGFKAFFIQKNNQFSPLLIESIQSSDEFTAHIKWKNYSSKEQAQLLHNREIFLDNLIAEKHFDLEEIDDYIGYTVYNFEDKLGEVMDIFENNFQETLDVKMENGKNVLIPFIDEFIETIDEDEKAIYCSLSPEFIEMFSN